MRLLMFISWRAHNGHGAAISFRVWIRRMIGVDLKFRDTGSLPFT